MVHARYTRMGSRRTRPTLAARNRAGARRLVQCVLSNFCTLYLCCSKVFVFGYKTLEHKTKPDQSFKTIFYNQLLSNIFEANVNVVLLLLSDRFNRTIFAHVFAT